MMDYTLFINLYAEYVHKYLYKLSDVPLILKDKVIAKINELYPETTTVETNEEQSE